MLAADRSAVETDLQAQAVQIKNIEMNNIDRYLQAISTQAALICGFAAAESFAVEYARKAVSQTMNAGSFPWMLHLLYFATTTLSLACEFYCLMNSTLVCVLGPTFALNGPVGSMHEAVFLMKEERLSILHAFWFGGLFFAMSQVFAAWIITEVETAITVTVVVTIASIGIRRSMNRISVKFRFENIFAKADEAIAGNREAKSGKMGSVRGAAFLREKENAKEMRHQMTVSKGIVGVGGIVV